MVEKEGVYPFLFTREKVGRGQYMGDQCMSETMCKRETWKHDKRRPGNADSYILGGDIAGGNMREII